ncbi:MAG: dihydrodipicolinate synthase family protein [Flavobacteriaceae bacterium]|nr:MAG: dihydrodipicolinate synthase family protein [Flavobacteriaceae bacterium]
MKLQWEGVMPALTTKFDEADRLDLALFEKNLQAQLQAGVSGIILGGTLGEASTLNTEEKETLTVKALEMVAGRVPVVLNIAESSTKSAAEAARRAEVIGADGLMLLPPMRYRPTKREARIYLQAVAESTSLPIMIYNNPIDYGTEVTLEMFEDLMDRCPNIQAVKESTRDVSNVTRLRNHFGDRLKILCGVDTLAMESLLMGADGWVAGLVCAFPRETVAVYALSRAGQIEQAREIYRWFMPLLELDINPQLVQNIKLAETLVGLGSEPVRPPRLPLAGSERDRVLSIIERALKERPKLPDYLELL